MRTPTRADLAGMGEDAADIVTGAQPYLQLAQRRQRTAALTPSGQPQPPEVAGVDADARVPNILQPMSGEFHSGAEVDEGRPAYFNPQMPPPTGLASNQIASPGLLQGGGTAPFGAPTGMSLPPALPAAQSNAHLTALPHFADGGVLPPGGTGVVGEAGQEQITALPSGAVRVTPLAGNGGPLKAADGTDAATPLVVNPTSYAHPQAPVSPAAPRDSAPPAAANGTPPSATSDSTGLDATAPDDPQAAAYQRAAAQYANETPPDPAAYQAHGLRRALADLAGIGVGAVSLNPLAGLAVHDAIAQQPARIAEQNYQTQRQSELSGLGQLKAAADVERDQTLDTQRQDDSDRTAQAAQQRASDTLALQQDAQQAQGRHIDHFIYDASGVPTGEAVLQNGQTISGVRPPGGSPAASAAPPAPITRKTPNGWIQFNPARNQWEPVVPVPTPIKN